MGSPRGLPCRQAMLSALRPAHERAFPAAPNKPEYSCQSQSTDAVQEVIQQIAALQHTLSHQHLAARMRFQIQLKRLLRLRSGKILAQRTIEYLTQSSVLFRRLLL